MEYHTYPYSNNLIQDASHHNGKARRALKSKLKISNRPQTPLSCLVQMSSLSPSTVADIFRRSVKHSMTLYSPSLTVTPSEIFWDYEVVLSRSRGEGRMQLHATNIQSVCGDNRGNTIPPAAPDTWAHKNNDNDISSDTINDNSIIHDIEHPVSCRCKPAHGISNNTQAEGLTQLHGTNIQSVCGDNRGIIIPSATPDTWAHKNDDHDISSGTTNPNAIVHDIEHPVSYHRRPARGISNNSTATSSSGKPLNNAKPRRSRRRAKPYSNQAERETLSHACSNTPSKRCPYVDRISGKQCNEVVKVAQDWINTRHWETVHRLKEAKIMSEGDMKIEDGTTITSENTLKEALDRLSICSVCYKKFTRKDALKRHMKTLHPKDFKALQA